jgi:hypothetical protein
LVRGSAGGQPRNHEPRHGRHTEWEAAVHNDRAPRARRVTELETAVVELKKNDDPSSPIGTFAPGTGASPHGFPLAIMGSAAPLLGRTLARGSGGGAHLRYRPSNQRSHQFGRSRCGALVDFG